MAIFIIDTEVSFVKQYAVEAETSAEAVEALESMLGEDVEEFSSTDPSEHVTMSRPGMDVDDAVAFIRETLEIPVDDPIWDDEMVESMILWYEDE